MYIDDFNGFFADRKERVLKKIEAAMGKNIARDQEVPEEGYFADEDEGNGDSDDLILNP
jgi:hypothetical protein